MKKKVDLLKDDIVRLFIRFVASSVSGMIMVSLYIMADTIFIGRGVGSEGLAALNIAIPMYNILFATGLLLGIGGATALSVSIGQKQFKKVNIIFTHSIVTALFLGLLYTVAGSIFLEPLSYFLGASRENISLVKEYLRIMMMFSTSFVMVYALTPLVRNDKAPKLAMWSTIAGGFTNIVLDALFIFKFHWGMKGAAIATVISSLVSLGLLCSHFVVGGSSLKLQKLPIQTHILKRIFLNGVPSFIIEISSGMVIFTFNQVILSFIGEIGVSAYSIIANISLICIAMFTGIAQGVQPIISVNYGAKMMERANRVRNMGLVCAVILGMIFFMMGNLFPEKIVHLFTNETGELIDITVQGIHYYFIGFVLMGVNIVMGMYFQSIEASSYSTGISVGRGIGFVILGLVVLPRFFEMMGVWMTVPFAELATCILAVCLYAKQLKGSVKYRLDIKDY
ncbi:MATE family efflux transporter [Clostridiaceae bacterium 35-E11]